jgi:hypothetical protein
MSTEYKLSKILAVNSFTSTTLKIGARQRLFLMRIYFLLIVTE